MEISRETAQVNNLINILEVILPGADVQLNIELSNLSKEKTTKLILSHITKIKVSTIIIYNKSDMQMVACNWR